MMGVEAECREATGRLSENTSTSRLAAEATGGGLAEFTAGGFPMPRRSEDGEEVTWTRMEEESSLDDPVN